MIRGGQSYIDRPPFICVMSGPSLFGEIDQGGVMGYNHHKVNCRKIQRKENNDA